MESEVWPHWDVSPWRHATFREDFRLQAQVLDRIK